MGWLYTSYRSMYRVVIYIIQEYVQSGYIHHTRVCTEWLYTSYRSMYRVYILLYDVYNHSVHTPVWCILALCTYSCMMYISTLYILLYDVYRSMYRVVIYIIQEYVQSGYIHHTRVCTEWLYTSYKSTCMMYITTLYILLYDVYNHSVHTPVWCI
jgi:hypothetical protein